MSIKVIYDSYSDVCGDYAYGKKFLDEPEKVIEKLNEHFDGVELSKETLQNYFDYEKLGRDVRLEEGGSFVDKGYFVSR